MEKYSQFRDRGSGIAPFFPPSPTTSLPTTLLSTLLFTIKLPLFLPIALSWFLLLRWLPLGPWFKKAFLWLLLGIPGIWWIDLQIDGVKRGSLAKHHLNRFPQPGNIIASSFTSPIDALYLAAIFDPIFTISWPSTRCVQRTSLWGAMVRALKKPEYYPPHNANLTTVGDLLKANPKRVIVVFPECTTSNGNAILNFAPSLLTVPGDVKIFPMSLRYTPKDIMTPVPERYWGFLWGLLGQPTHGIRVRIAEAVFNTNGGVVAVDEKEMMDRETGDDGEVSGEEQVLLETVRESLARLGRVKRVKLGVKEKEGFVKALSKRKT